MPATLRSFAVAVLFRTVVERLVKALIHGASHGQFIVYVIIWSCVVPMRCDLLLSSSSSFVASASAGPVAWAPWPCAAVATATKRSIAFAVSSAHVTGVLFACRSQSSHDLRGFIPRGVCTNVQIAAFVAKSAWVTCFDVFYLSVKLISRQCGVVRSTLCARLGRTSVTRNNAPRFASWPSAVSTVPLSESNFTMRMARAAAGTVARTKSTLDIFFVPANCFRAVIVAGSGYTPADAVCVGACAASDVLFSSSFPADLSAWFCAETEAFRSSRSDV